MTQLTAIVFAVKIPEDIDNLIIQDGWLVDNWADEEYIPIVKLPHGSYTLLFCSKDVTEDLANGVVEKSPASKLYMDYEATNSEWLVFCFKTALESFSSLLQSKSLSGNHAILNY